MLKKLSLLLSFLMGVMSVSAHYTIHSTTEGVKIESGGSSVAAEKGKEVKANDYIVIPDGGEVEIYNDLDKNIYKSTTPGKISVTRLMIDAKKTASDNNKNVASRLRFAKGSSNEQEGEKIYTEKGMVRRSLAVFDPEAVNLQVDSKTLANQIIRFLNVNDTTGYTNVAVDVATGVGQLDGTSFRIINNLEFPVYFNVLKFDETPADDQRKVEISNLGQPDGNYVLLPGQSITRESFLSFPPDEKHLLIITHFRYDLDEVVDETNNLQNSEREEIGSPVFPLLIKEL